MKLIKNKQSGFTLVEIAIVLVIIGLLLGGVLKGQEMIENGKIKNAINDLNGVTAAYNAYIDRFHALPGDDGGSGVGAPSVASLQARGGAWTSVTVAGNNNGVIAATQANVFAAGGETVQFWQELKAAGFIAGNPADAGVAALPRNAFNGLTGVGTGVTPTAGTAVFSVCQSQVPGKSARAIDTQMDDTVSNKGGVLATQSLAAGANTAPGAAAAAYTDDNQYTVCKSM
ncbi:MAG TPA: prepilin-type N-terminal cleavage/methylation domain-containing protein [Burkholderiaceae bacterium]|jgi:prepilin-type N-terminal cleavage/methylation domain-containing protein